MTHINQRTSSTAGSKVKSHHISIARQTKTMARETITSSSRTPFHLDGASTPNPPRRANQLSDQQRTRLFACLCVARYIHGAKDNDDTLTMDIYEETLALMEPHWQPLEFDHEPSFITICKIWKDFLRTGLIIHSKCKTKIVGAKVSKLTRGDDDTNTKKDSKSPVINYSIWGFIVLCLVMPIILSLISAQEPQEDLAMRDSRRQYELKVKNHLDKIKSRYSNSLTPKQLRTIRARLEMMKSEVSILLLVGRAHDIKCQVDETFCIGQAIANISQYPQFGYIDARDVRLDSNDLTAELAEVLDERNDVMVIDSLDRLPGSEVMSLFQFIDRDQMNKRRKGLLLLIMYTDRNMEYSSLANMREAEIVERILVPRWSNYVRGDTLTSVISRISGTIIKVQ